MQFFDFSFLNLDVDKFGSGNERKSKTLINLDDKYTLGVNLRYDRAWDIGMFPILDQ